MKHILGNLFKLFLFILIGSFCSCSSDSDWSELMRRNEVARIKEYKDKNQNDQNFDVKIWKIKF